ncbi:MAG TPA: RNase adapter RapZ [Pedococcus sp.]|uniref:RNase adapter RapZ n=1 Tax=Pedococcus sp. TaxID=2860345 RepID=UPI002F945BB6
MTDPEARPAPERTELVIVTGMSGAGRTTTANVLEDSGWYVVDNLPPHLLVPLTELAGKRQGADGVPRIAAVVDVRARGFTHLRESLDELRSRGWRPNLVFLDATDEALVRRFESVRRPHPLQGEGRLLDGIVRERSLLQDLRADADVVIDTSGLNVHQLAKKVAPVFTKEAGPRLRIAVMSFGFKYGVPLDADFVFDMRFLPNPFWIPELRNFSGKDEPVAEFVMGQEGASEFIDRVVDLMRPVTAGYVREGRRYATIGVGCTGGKHRSVAVAEALAMALGTGETATFVVHRDLGQE